MRDSELRRARRRRAAILGMAAAGWAGGWSATPAARADPHPLGVPQLNSRPGAAYTIYLDFGGFAFNGSWGSSTPSAGNTPGTEPAYDGQATYFTATEQGSIQKMWAAVANKYADYNINVTTVDPAVAAGQVATDAQRQAYYDRTAKLMHTVVASDAAQDWNTAGGESYVGVDAGTTSLGRHTDWVFTNHLGGATAIKTIGEAAGHENGHGLGLNHQIDYNTSTGSSDDSYSTNSGASGNGSVAPMMGDSYSAQRGTFRYGTLGSGSLQNDPKVIAADSGMGGFQDDGVAHTMAAAALVPVASNGSGGIVNTAAARGFIAPASATSPNPIGADNYTSDYYRFNAAGGAVTLVVHNGDSHLLPGTADQSPTLASSLTIYNASGGTVSTVAESYATQTETFSQALAAGTYYAKVSSAGGQTFTYTNTSNGYYDMGGYFLTGSGLIGRSVGTFYWAGGASTARWSQVDGTATTNFRTELAGAADAGTVPGATDNVFLSVAGGASNLSSMALGGSRSINSLTFTGTGTAAATTPVTIVADGSTLTLNAAEGHVDGSGTAVAADVGLVVQPGAAADTIGADVALAVGQTWQLNQSAANPLTVSGVLSGTTGSGLTLTGAGKLVLTRANTYTGPTAVNGPTLSFAAGSLGTGPVTILGAGTLQFAAGNTADLTANGRAVAVASGGGQIDTNGNAVVLAGGVADAFAGYLTKVGAGSLAIGGTSNPTNLFVRGGELSLLAGASISTANGGTGNQYVSVGQVTGDTGTLTVAGATLTVAGDLNAGDQATTNGTIRVLPGAVVNVRNLYLAKYGNSTGTVTQTGGTVQEADNGTAAVDWRIGGGTGTGDRAAVGTYTISAGTLSSGGQNLQVGAYGTGTLAQTGGTVTAGGYVSIGRYPGSVGTVDLSAGTGVLTAAAPQLIVGEQGTGTLKVGGGSVVNANTLAVGRSNGLPASGTVNQTGGTVNTATGVSFGSGAAGTVAVSAAYTLAGGTLNTPSVGQGTAAGITGAFTFAGGTLAATGSTAAFMQGLTRAVVSGGGAQVDTGGYTVTVAQPLLHDGTVAGPDGGLTKLGAGTLTLAGVETYTGPTNVSAGTLTFAANVAGAGVRRQLLPGGVTVAAGATATLAAAATPADRTLLVPTGLTIAGQFDVANDDLDVVGGSLAAITAAAAAGFAGGTWAGTTGLISSVAAADGNHLTAVGVIQNAANDGDATPIYGSFDGQPVSATDVLARYTYYGDTNLDGVVNASDYTRIDAGFVGRLTGWANGDFDYDGVVDGSDYTLMDNAFNEQSGGIAAPAVVAASPAVALPGGTVAVPEPATLGVLAAGVLLAGRSRRRHR